MSKARDIASAAPAPAGVTSTELGYVDGVTSAIQTQINAQIPKSTVTAKGDLIVGTGSGAFVAQGVGANGTVLTANSAQADGVEWANAVASVSGTAGRITVTGTGTPTIDLATSGVTAGTYGSSTTIPQVAVDAYGRVTSISNAGLTASSAMTLVGSQTVSSGSITFSSIPAHKSLVAHIYGIPSSSGNGMGMRINGITSASYCTNNIGYQASTPFILRTNPAGGSLGSQTDSHWFVGRAFGANQPFTAMITFPTSGASRTLKTFFAQTNYDNNEGIITPTFSNGFINLGSAGAITTIVFFSLNAVGGSTTVDLYALS